MQKERTMMCEGSSGRLHASENRTTDDQLSHKDEERTKHDSTTRVDDHTRVRTVLEAK